MRTSSSMGQQSSNLSCSPANASTAPVTGGWRVPDPYCAEQRLGAPICCDFHSENRSLLHSFALHRFDQHFHSGRGSRILPDSISGPQNQPVFSVRTPDPRGLWFSPPCAYFLTIRPYRHIRKHSMHITKPTCSRQVLVLSSLLDIQSPLRVTASSVKRPFCRFWVFCISYPH